MKTEDVEKTTGEKTTGEKTTGEKTTGEKTTGLDETAARDFHIDYIQGSSRMTAARVLRSGVCIPIKIGQDQNRIGAGAGAGAHMMQAIVANKGQSRWPSLRRACHVPDVRHLYRIFLSPVDQYGHIGRSVAYSRMIL